MVMVARSRIFDVLISGENSVPKDCNNTVSSPPPQLILPDPFSQLSDFSTTLALVAFYTRDPICPHNKNTIGLICLLRLLVNPLLPSIGN